MPNTFVEQDESEMIVAHENEKYFKTYSNGSGDGSVQRKEEGKGKPHQRVSLAQSFSVKGFSLVLCLCSLSVPVLLWLWPQ